MRFKLTITAQRGNSIPINYQYPLSAAIHKILATGDSQYTQWLQLAAGYSADTYNFKLFKFFVAGHPMHRKQMPTVMVL